MRTPPRWAQRFIEWYCKPELAEDLLGDLNEYFERNVERIGARRATIIYIIDTIKFLRPYTIRKPKFVELFISWIMIGSYIKTSGRNVMRNKLFSSINIIGLAISMSVGLLMIGLLHDLTSYDQFHAKRSRIYRLTSRPTISEADWGWFASSSLKAASVIKEEVPGIEEITVLRNGFSNDAIIGDKVIPMEALWAEPSLFNVFTFPMISGHPATALKEPYSIVLTEGSAKKLFGDKPALGQAIKFDTLSYQVTGVIKDVPFFSHFKFEALVSMSTYQQQNSKNPDINKWDDMWSNYTYLLLPPNADLRTIESNIDAIATTNNASSINTKIELDLQHINDIVLGKDLSNAFGTVVPASTIYIVSALAAIVILSACFNYTNLSIARSLRRFKEVGLRKAIGAGKSDVRQQFLFEAVIISIASLVLSLVIFLLLRPLFLDIADFVRLELTPPLVLYFVAFSIVVGILAGFLPALFFARVNIIQALKDSSSVKVFKHINLRKALVVVQYSFTLMFITATVIGYQQYKGFLSYNLGFNTDNIVNLRLENNKPELIMKELAEIPEVTGISRSRIVTSLGNYWGARLKYKNMNDSSNIWFNAVDENYFPLHGHRFAAGTNFISRPAPGEKPNEVIVNKETLTKFNIANPADPESAIGEDVFVNGRKLKIVGVLDDFHYGRVDTKKAPVVFTFNTDQQGGYLNLKVQTSDIGATMARLEEAWKKIDKVHPMSAAFYNDAIEDSYREYSVMTKIIGFLAFLAISIASMGLFGMVVFTTETRLKEIGIRKVMGATSGNLVFLLSRGFIVLLSISAAIALPTTYVVFKSIILIDIPYHSPIGVVEMFVGLLGVLLLAFIMIGSQTLKATRNNPAEVLRSE